MINLALVQEIIQLLIQAVQAGIQYGPELIADIKLVWQLATTQTTLTPEQQTLADTTLAAAHQQLQAQVAQDAQQDAPAAVPGTPPATQA